MRAPAPRDPLESSFGADEKPPLTLDKVTPNTLCVTRGRVADPQFRIDVPTFRAVAPGHSGDAADMKVIVYGTTEKENALSSGEMRRQIGLKLRADNGCNLVYVMWRLDPKPKLVVSVKRNPGMRTAKDCGAGGYTNVKPLRTSQQGMVLPALDDGKEHALRAEISGDALYAWIDGQLAWQGMLPASAHDLTGPAGVRSDNLSFDLTGFSVDSRAGGQVAPKCLAARSLDDQTDESD